MNIRVLLEQQAEKYADKTFLCFGDQEITYFEFNRKVNQVANGFRKLGVHKGQRVALMLPNTPAFLYSWMGLNKIGAIEVPININYKEAEISYILNHSESVGIVIDRAFFPIFERIGRSNVPDLTFAVVYGGEDFFAEVTPFSSLLNEKETLEGVDILEEDPAVCIYTSGTTDRPKGVLNSHKSWVLTGQSYAFTVGILQEDRVMTPNPLFHANAQVYSTMGALSAGATLILLERFSASTILDQARRYGSTILVLVQAVTPWLWNQPVRENDGDNPIRTLIAGGIPKDIYRKFEERYQVRVQTIYSLTESVMAIMGPREGRGERKPGGIGVPMEYPDPDVRNEAKVVDGTGIEVGKGEKGEIVIRNPSTMIGYFKDPLRTAEAKRDGWIFSGDLGYQDEDGYFFFVGRKKEVIRRRGELISPSEIEAVISSHPRIDEVAVVGVASGLGTGEEEVKAFVRMKEGEHVEPEEVFGWCRKRLAEFKVPRFLEFREEFPRSAIGRIQKNLLQKEGTAQALCFDRFEMNQ